MHYCQVAVNADACQEEDAAVHVDKVAKDVNQGTFLAIPCSIEHDDPDRQEKAHQEISYDQVDGVNNRGGFCLGTEAEDVQCQAVQHNTHQENDGIDYHQDNPYAIKISVQVFI